jgi:taurine---2-oxoglutarate transaminase
MKKYFYTWTDQTKVQNFELHSTKDHQLKIDDNKEVYDLSSMSCQSSFGYSCKEIISAIQKQLTTLPMASPKADFKLKEDVTNKLISLLNLDGKIFYTISGAESIENALKIARQIKKKQVIVARNKSYHGATLGALSLTGDWRNKEHETIDDWTLRVLEPCDDPDASLAIEAMEKLGIDKIAAICLETITGGNGVFEASQVWWDNISKFCKTKNIFLILDEVICGFYRTGKAFGFQHYNLKPDFIALSKSISGGYIPFGALWTSNDVAKYYDTNILSCGLTNYAHPLGLAALDAIIKLTTDSHFKETMNENISILKESLSEIKNVNRVKTVRQIGLLAAIDLETSQSFKDILNKGLYLMTSDKRIILAPALNYNPKQLKSALKLLHKILEEEND